MKCEVCGVRMHHSEGFEAARGHILTMLEAGPVTLRQVAERLGVPDQTARRWLMRAGALATRRFGRTDGRRGKPAYLWSLARGREARS